MEISNYRLKKLLILISIFYIIDSKSISVEDTKRSDISNSETDANLLQDKYETPLSTKRHSDDDSDIASASGTNLEFKVPKINTLGTRCYDVPSSKRSTEDNLDLGDKNHLMIKSKKRNPSPFGIVYNEGRPIGVLEPISQFYEFSNYNEKESMNDLDQSGESVDKDFGKRSLEEYYGHNPDKYAHILTNFKISSRMKVRPLDEEVAIHQRKRSRTIGKRSADNKKKINMVLINEKNERNLNEIENNLKEIMDDLGLINDETKIDKRGIDSDPADSTYTEDEDLERGINKISMTKEAHPSVQRGKKADCPGKTGNSETDKSHKDDKAEAKKAADYTAEGEAFIRKKRQQESAENSNEVLKDLETSGDLTVSGNKSPLASSSSSVSDSNETKQKIQRDSVESEKKSSNEDTEYEKRLQRNIQDKITQIKEEVKREITALKEASATTVVSVEKKKRHSVEDAKKIVRSKRNLMDLDHNQLLDPGINLEDKLVPHLRRRRDINQDEDKADGDVARVTWQELEEGNHHPLHDPNLYEVQYRAKRNSDDAIKSPLVQDVDKRDVCTTKSRNEEVTKAQDMTKSKAKGKREVNVKTVEGGETNFRDVQNQNVVKRAPDTSANAIRSSEAEDVDVASNEQGDEGLEDQQGKERLERAQPSIEIELHSGTSPSSDVKEDDAIKSDDKPVRETKTNKQVAHIVTDKRSFIGEKSYPQTVALLQSSGNRKKIVAASSDVHSREVTVDGEDTSTDVNNVPDAKVSYLTGQIIDDDEDAALTEDKDTDLKFTERKSKLWDNNKGTNQEEDLDDNNSKLTPDALNMAQATDVKESKREVINTNNVAIANSAIPGRKDEEAQFNNLNDNHEDSDREATRKERMLEPSITLEEMQNIDSANDMKRKRREVIVDDANNLEFRNYRSDEDDIDDNENDEFDDDNFDDRTSNLIRKRAAATVDTDYDDYESLKENGRKRRHSLAKTCVAKLNADAYDVPNFLYDSAGEQDRKKRHVSSTVDDDVSSLHSGGPMIRHMAAAKERNQQNDNNYRRKRLEKLNQVQQAKEQSIAGLSESDVFGGLPQSYEGELSRFKRVKRDKD